MTLYRAWWDAIRMTGPLPKDECETYVRHTAINGLGNWEIRPAEWGMHVSPRSEVSVHYPEREDNGTSYKWQRTICGIPYSFTHVTMPNGEERFFVSKYNGYVGGVKFGCAWSQVREKTWYPDGRTIGKRFDN